jgi:hypothetical protein
MKSEIIEAIKTLREEARNKLAETDKPPKPKEEERN